MLVAAQVHDGHPYTPMEVANFFHHTESITGTGSSRKETDEALQPASSPCGENFGNYGGLDVVGRPILFPPLP